MTGFNSLLCWRKQVTAKWELPIVSGKGTFFSYLVNFFLFLEIFIKNM